MKLKALFDVQDGGDINVKGLTQNSKEVRAGYVFFAVKGNTVDGHHFIESAVEAGACAVVSEQDYPVKIKVPYIKVKNIDAAMADAAAKFYKNPSDDMFVIGVTGTKGKTSISYLLESIFTMAQVPVSVIGTINYRINGTVISQAPNTTPAALTLYKMLADMRRSGTKVLIMEVSSHALELCRVRGVNFDLAIFTNLQRDHLDFHKDFDNYFAAKKKLFVSLAENSKKTKTAIINTDDKYGKTLAKEFAALNILPCSLKEASAVKTALDGVSFTYKKQKIHINLLGEHNIYNALFALKAAEAYGIDLKTAAGRLDQLKGVPGRMERIDKGQPFYVYVDFAYTEEAMKKAFETVLPYKTGRIMIVFGCGGQRDTTKRPLMGRCACINSDKVYITNDNPRKEDPENIFKDILAGTEDCENYVLMPDRAAAIKAAVKECRPGDILIVAGKGHEDYQILGSKKIHFSDKEHIEEALKETGYV